MAMCVHNCENGGVGGKEKKEWKENKKKRFWDLYREFFGGFDYCKMSRAFMPLT